jgi:hypothetical protein
MFFLTKVAREKERSTKPRSSQLSQAWQPWRPPPPGVVHAWVGQKLLKCHNIKSFYERSIAYIFTIFSLTQCMM